MMIINQNIVILRDKMPRETREAIGVRFSIAEALHLQTNSSKLSRQRILQ